MTRPRNPKAEAAAWFERLGHRQITTAELHEFWTWRDDPANKAAYRAVEKAGMRLRGRFVPIPDPHGFSVIETWTGEPATFANVRPRGVSQEDADYICDVLNRRFSQTDAPGHVN